MPWQCICTTCMYIVVHMCHHAVCVYVCVGVYMCVCMCVCMCGCMCVCVGVYMCVYVYVWVYVCVCGCVSSGLLWTQPVDQLLPPFGTPEHRRLQDVKVSQELHHHQAGSGAL